MSPVRNGLLRSVGTGHGKEDAPNDREAGGIAKPQSLTTLEGTGTGENASGGIDPTVRTPMGPRLKEMVALSKRTDERTYEDLQILEDILLKVHFGTDVPRQKRLDVCKYLEYVSMPEHSVVFRQGDIGDAFYIIISGLVRVSLSKPGSLDVQVAAYLKAGDSFGELALLHPAAERRATITCCKDAEFLTLRREHYEATLKSDTHRDIAEKITFLKQVKLFRKLPYSRVESIALVLTKREILPKQIVSRQGEELEDMFFIIQGRVKMIRSIKLNKQEHKKQGERLPRISSSRMAADSQVFVHERRGGMTPQPHAKPTGQAEFGASIESVAPSPMPENSSEKKEPENRLQRLVTKHRGTIMSNVFKARKKQRDAAGKMFAVTMAALRAAKDEREKQLTAEEISAFQHISKIERGGWLYLEASEAGKNEYFGERCILKSSRQPTTIVTTCTTTVYVLNKWDLLKRIDQKTIDMILQNSHDQIDEEALQQQYMKSEKWNAFKKGLVDSVVKSNRAKKLCTPTCLWGSMRARGDVKLPALGGKWK